MSIDPKDSPLNRATQINRDVADHLTAVQEDAFSEEAEFTEVLEDDGIDAFSENPTPPRERKTSPPEPDFQEGAFEEDFGAFNPGPQVNPEDEKNREIFAKGILDAIRTMSDDSALGQMRKGCQRIAMISDWARESERLRGILIPLVAGPL